MTDVYEDDLVLSDFVAMAISMARTRYDWYKSLAAATRDARVRHYTRGLAANEKHRMGAMAHAAGLRIAPASEVGQQLISMAQRMIAPDADMAPYLAASGCFDGVTAIAIKMEQDGIFFCQQLREIFPMHSLTLVQIMVEQEKHLEQLVGMQAAAVRTGT